MQRTLMKDARRGLHSQLGDQFGFPYCFLLCTSRAFLGAGPNPINAGRERFCAQAQCSTMSTVGIKQAAVGSACASESAQGTLRPKVCTATLLGLHLRFAPQGCTTAVRNVIRSTWFENHAWTLLSEGKTLISHAALRPTNSPPGACVAL